MSVTTSATTSASTIKEDTRFSAECAPVASRNYRNPNPELHALYILFRGIWDMAIHFGDPARLRIYAGRAMGIGNSIALDYFS